MMRTVHIVGIAARTPVGLTARASAAAARAGIRRVLEHPDLRDRRGEPISIALDLSIQPGLMGPVRLVELARQPLVDVLSILPTGTAQRPTEVDVLMAFPEPRPGWDEKAMTQATQRLMNVAPHGFRTRLRHIDRGHAGGLQALSIAAEEIASGQAEVVIVGGVDSYYDVPTLGWLERSRRLRVESGRSGFSPGEGAAFILLASQTVQRSMGLPSLARLEGFGNATETRTIESGTDVLGQGLADALQLACRNLQEPRQVDDIYCDVNGERYRSDEWAFAILRAQPALRTSDYHAPADCWGDLGAASGPLFCIQSVCAWERGYARGPLALSWASSNSGLRSAVVLRAP